MRSGAFSETRKPLPLKLRTRPPWAILAARAVMGGRGEETADLLIERYGNGVINTL